MSLSKKVPAAQPTVAVEPYVPFRYARQQAVAIANDRIDFLSREARAQVLEVIDDILEQWKAEQAAPDGTVEVPIARGLLGLPTLGDLLHYGEVRRVQVSELLPHQCAGLDCAADLWARLWHEKYPGVSKVPEWFGLDKVMALLLQRDGMTMSADSIASAIRYIWIFVYSQAREYAAELHQKEKKLAEQRAEASAIGAAKKRANAESLHSEWNTIAHQLWIADPKLTVKAAAVKVHLQMVARRPKSPPPSVRRIIDVIGPTKQVALTTLSRAYQHKT